MPRDPVPVPVIGEGKQIQFTIHNLRGIAHRLKLLTRVDVAKSLDNVLLMPEIAALCLSPAQSTEAQYKAALDDVLGALERGGGSTELVVQKALLRALFRYREEKTEEEIDAILDDKQTKPAVPVEPEESAPTMAQT